MKRVYVLLSLLLGATCAPGTTFHVDPASGSVTNDGSAERPWATLEEVLAKGLIQTRTAAQRPYRKDGPLRARNPNAPVKPGDVILCRSGYHGTPSVSGYNELPVTLAAAPGHAPELGSIHFRSASRWVLRGFRISPSLAPRFKRAKLVWIESHGWSGPSSEIAIESCELFSVPDTAAWTREDWCTRSCDGIDLGGGHCIAISNRLENVKFGIIVGWNAKVRHNAISNFSADAIRANGQYSEISYNLIKNCYQVDGNHADAIQSFSTGPKGQSGQGTVKGVVLRGNTIVNYTDPRQPFRGALQGIGCFDGFYEDWVVEHNLIVVDMWHGITMGGAINCRIVNNTICDLNDKRPGPPWLMVSGHKRRGPSRGCVIRDNLVTRLSGGPGEDGQMDHNVVITDPRDFFADFDRLDFRLKPGCPAVGAASDGGNVGARLYADPRGSDAAVAAPPTKAP